MIKHEWIDGIECKECSKCEAIKPLSQYVKSKQNADGLHIYCNDCRKELKKAEYIRNKGIYQKRFHDYYYKNHEIELEKRRQYRDENREAIYATNRIWRDTHKEEKREMDKQYRLANAQRIAIRLAEYQKTESYKEAHKAHNQKYTSTPNGQTKRQMQRERYRSRRANTSSTLTELQWRLCKEFFFHCCAYCGKLSKRLTQEHFVPVSDGGGYDVNNIIPCCKSCNSSKQSQNFFLWYPRQEFFDEQRKAKILEYLALF